MLVLSPCQEPTSNRKMLQFTLSAALPLRGATITHVGLNGVSMMILECCLQLFSLPSALLSRQRRAADVAYFVRHPPILTLPQEPLSLNTGPVENGTLSRDVFDQARRQIYDLTDADAFPRFTQSIHAQMQVRRTHSKMSL